MSGIIKGLIEGGLKGLGETAKGIIHEVAEGKLNASEAILKVDQEANRHAEAINGQAIELDRAYLQTVKDAQDYNAKIQESDKSSWMAKNIAFIIDLFIAFIWGVFTLYLAAIAAKLLESKADMTGLLSIYSTITAVFMITVNFHRGTSKGSEDKQKTIDRLSKK